MERVYFMLGALFALLAVAAGAFGAHALRGVLAVDLAAVFETAVRYQLMHALALLATAWACDRWPGTATTAAGALFIAGIVLFSGSLYLLALTGLRALGTITPFGGGAFIAGWGCLAWAAWRRPGR
ncbi:MAG TPA: DUF423 domain-containing protein [Burkholderiaceae bacterium]|nr:DUF423 domain-containing protein [Burkholderiaceae bacterium]